MMKDKIKDLIDKAPANSGVYQFLGVDDAVLYVGKAKNLRKRLLNYTVDNRLSARIRHMVFLAEKVEFTQTESELAALLLEHNLIKKLAPKYNILLRDDKTFPAIIIDKKHAFGRIDKHRGALLINSSANAVGENSLSQKSNLAAKNNYHYFGPFASGLDVNRVLDVLRKNFLLRSCSDSEFKSRTKPCLEYQIKKCSAPCVGLISQDDYQKSIAAAVNFLSGKSSEMQSVLADKMRKLSEEQNYEQAALVRDQIKSLSSIQAKQNVNLSDITDKDIISLVEAQGKYCVYISFYRAGNNYGSKPYFYSVEEGLSGGEFLAKFLGQFYLNQTPPEELLLNCEIEDVALMEEFLSELAAKKVVVKIPQQGDKFKLIKDQEHIARQVLQQKIEQNLNEKELLIEIKNLFQLSDIPNRIEVYDNSHISGKYAVGVLICAGPEGFIKSGYRKYNIELENLENKDDTAMLREVLRRRFRVVSVITDSKVTIENAINSTENPSDKKSNEKLTGLATTKNQPSEKSAATAPVLPSFIIIDGGIGQLNAAQEVFDELDVKVPFTCMSKGPNRNAGEEYFHRFGQESFTLPKNHKVMYYLQRLRDEAHRFAITTHRSKRQKSVTKSTLDEVPNIGAKRKKALLNHFGSVDKIKSATVEDLMRVEGISLAIANKVWGFFR